MMIYNVYFFLIALLWFGGSSNPIANRSDDDDQNPEAQARVAIVKKRLQRVGGGGGGGGSSAASEGRQLNQINTSSDGTVSPNPSHPTGYLDPSLNPELRGGVSIGGGILPAGGLVFMERNWQRGEIVSNVGRPLPGKRTYANQYGYNEGIPYGGHRIRTAVGGGGGGGAGRK